MVRCDRSWIRLWLWQIVVLYPQPYTARSSERASQATLAQSGSVRRERDTGRPQIRRHRPFNSWYLKLSGCFRSNSIAFSRPRYQNPAATAKPMRTSVQAAARVP